MTKTGIPGRRARTRFGAGCLAGAVVLLGISFSCKRETVDPGQVVARVAGRVLTVDELREGIPERFQQTLSPAELREFAMRWINDQALYEEAMVRGLDESEDLNAEFMKLRRELLINRLLEVAVPPEQIVGEEEIKEYYDMSQDAFILSEDLVRTYHLLLKTRAEASAIRKRLLKSESFEKIAKELQTDSTDVDEWDFGYYSAEEVISEISTVAFKLRKEAISQPIKSKFGYHLIKLVDKQKKGDVKPLESVRNEIKRKLLTKKRQARYERFLQETKSKLTIETNFDLLSAPGDSLTFLGE